MYNFLYKHLDFIRISDLLGNLGIITIGSNTEKRLCFKSPLFCYDCISPPLQLVSLSMPNSSDFLKMAIKIRRENWKKRNVFVVRDGGKLLSWVNVKGSKLNLLSAKNLFKKNNTFKKGVKKEVTKLTNMVEIKEFQEVKFSKGQLPVLFSSKLKTTKQKAKVLQYIISAKLKNGETIVARSQSLGGIFAQNKKEMIKEATQSFFELLDHSLSGGYDEDSGKVLFNKNVVSVQEGWIHYRNRSDRASNAPPRNTKR